MQWKKQALILYIFWVIKGQKKKQKSNDKNKNKNKQQLFPKTFSYIEKGHPTYNTDNVNMY